MHVSVSILSPNQRLIYTEISGGLWNWTKIVAHGYINKVFHLKKCTVLFFSINVLWYMFCLILEIQLEFKSKMVKKNLTSNIQYIKRGGALTCYINYTHLIQKNISLKNIPRPEFHFNSLYIKSTIHNN